jgi:predicted ATPase
MFLYLLADAHARAGQIDEARAVINEALTLMNQTEERVWEPEIHRFNGDLYLKDAPAEAEKHYQYAFAQSRSQRARSNELRAALSLAKLWHSQGKTTEAHELLQPMYAAFTEGFTTSDLVGAKELLSVLEK